MGHDNLNLAIYDLTNLRTPLLKFGSGLSDLRIELKAASATVDKISYSTNSDGEGRNFLTASKLIQLKNGVGVPVLLSMDSANDETQIGRASCRARVLQYV